jgi:ketosteroid isomerase-like protein
MSTDPGDNAIRLGVALAPFEDEDLVRLFRGEESRAAIRDALERIAADDMVTLMIGADHGLTGTFNGVNGFIDAWTDFTETFQHLHNSINEMTEVGPDVVYIETKQVGATATAGVEVTYQAAAVFRFGDGLLQQAEFHLDRDAARRAAGIAPGNPTGS